MDDDIIAQIHSQNCRIVELEARLQRPKDWSSGEIEIFKRQIESARCKLNELNSSKNLI